MYFILPKLHNSPFERQNDLPTSPSHSEMDPITSKLTNSVQTFYSIYSIYCHRKEMFQLLRIINSIASAACLNTYGS